jgi:predicted Rdx family selenoprotein
LTSGDAGKILPLKYIPMLREDAVQRGRIRVNIEMQETAELLMNGVAVNVMAHYVPMLAFDRFNGSMEELNRSYQGVAGIGGEVVPFFETNKRYVRSTGLVDSDDTTAAAWDIADLDDPDPYLFYQTMGLHFNAQNLNMAVVEAYNAIVNHRRKARSKNLPVRDAFDHSLAEAFWLNSGNNHIVPDFDQSLIDGEVPLSGLNFQAPIVAQRLVEFSNGTYTLNPDTTTGPYNGSYIYSPGSNGANVVSDGDVALFEDMYADLTQGGTVAMSLADIEQAKKTAAFAKMRSMYDGIDDDHIIDLLMEGIRVPEETMSQPILIGRQQTMIGYRQRYATDAANLDVSATNGFAQVDMTVRTPRMNTGGVIMVTAEIVPEQLWERKKDYFLYTTSTEVLPNALRDELDPEKVSVVKNDHLDVNHSNPDATFGYAPLNHEWQRDMVNVGGKYYRPANDAFDEDRAKIWTVETTDPTLSDDFYLCSGLHKKVFADQVSDAFEIMCISELQISGNTIFGERLLEADATSDYQAITDLVDSNRIEK